MVDDIDRPAALRAHHKQHITPRDKEAIGRTMIILAREKDTDIF